MAISEAKQHGYKEGQGRGLILLLVAVFFWLGCCPASTCQGKTSSLWAESVAATVLTDFDGDRTLDRATSVSDSEEGISAVRVYLSRSPRQIQLPLAGKKPLVLARDVDRDGDIDLLAFNRCRIALLSTPAETSVALWLNDGNGVFERKISLDLLSRSRAVALPGSDEKRIFSLNMGAGPLDYLALEVMVDGEFYSRLLAEGDLRRINAPYWLAPHSLASSLTRRGPPADLPSVSA